jgi:hypothetical protein
MGLAGGGVKCGQIYGETDEMSFILSGIRSTSAICTPPFSIPWDWITRRLTYKVQGLDQKLTGTEPSRVVKELFA